MTVQIIRPADRICSVEGCDRSILALGYCRAHYHRLRRHGDPLGGGTAMNATVQWLRDHVDHEGRDCLIWPFSTTRGYGQTWWDGRPQIASRVMCTLVHGDPPSALHEAAHSCGRGDQGCVNPRHLSWKTRTGNCHDRTLHGTDNRGERHGMSRLTQSDVAEIRKLRGTISQRKLAKRFDVTQQTISDIQTGKRWAWMGEANHAG